MAIKIDHKLTPQKLLPRIGQLFELSAQKILSLERTWKPADGAPVITVKGQYTSRGWTEWTQGFQYGSALLQFDATGDRKFLELGRHGTIERMAVHVSHVGVHDHGFNNVSTYGNLLRLMREGKIEWGEREKDFYELALKVSGAVQAARWTNTGREQGFIYSFNGPHSLFVDTLRSLRSLAVAHGLGHVLMGEHDKKFSLLGRLIQHAEVTATHNIYYGAGRDAFDVWGRTAHESIFNLNDGRYRCPNSQQGYSPLSTWTRGLAWAICGFAEQLEFFEKLPRDEIAVASSLEYLSFVHADESVLKTSKSGKKRLQEFRSRSRASGGEFLTLIEKAATATADFYLAHCCDDGIPMWDTGAPSLHCLPANYLNQPSDPFNRFEPVDSSAAAIAAQGLIRLGNYLSAPRYKRAGLTIARTLFSQPYLSTGAKHQGLILHSVYHRPNGWDYVAPGQKVPNGESSMWGDYHARELALMILREAKGQPYLTFFGCVK